VVIERLIGSLEVVVEGERGEPALCTGSAADPRIVKAGDAHRKRLESFFDQIPHDVVEVTIEIALRKGGQEAGGGLIYCGGG